MKDMADEEFENLLLSYERCREKIAAIITENPRLMCTYVTGGITLAMNFCMKGDVGMLEHARDALLSLEGPHEQLLKDAFERPGAKGCTPAGMAATLCRLDCLEFLTKNCPSGLDILISETDNGITPICNAAYWGDRSIREFVVKNFPGGVGNLNKGNKYGRVFLGMLPEEDKKYFTPEKIRELGSQKVILN